MRRFRIILITALGALAVPLIAASSASADVYSCAFTGATGEINTAVRAPEGNAVESIQRDLADTDPDDSIGIGSGLGDPLTDTDNGSGGPGSWLAPTFQSPRTTNDGSYTFDTLNSPVNPNPSACVFADTNGTPGAVSGVYPIRIQSAGQYENVVCGTGIAVGDPASLATQVTDTGPALGTGATGFQDVTAASYTIRFNAGQGVLTISSASNGDTTTVADGDGGGVVNIVPSATNDADPNDALPAEGCVTGDVTNFLASGVFAAVGL